MSKKRFAKDSFDTSAANYSIWRRLLRYAFVAAIWGGIVLTLLLAWYARDLAGLTRKQNVERKRAVTVYASDGQTVIGRYGEAEGTAVRVDELPRHVPEAFLAIEDRRFYYHFGIDPIGLVRAFYVNYKTGHVVQGGSTITQQLAKNLFLKPDRTLERKIQEAILALWLEVKYSKDEILSAYLNRVYFGAGAYGITAAADVYFNKKPQQLTVQEAAMLAGLLKAPSKFSPENSRDMAMKRMNQVLTAMDESGYLDPDRENKGGDGRPVPSRKPISLRDTITPTRYVTDWVVEEANALLGENGDDLMVMTTIEAPLQQKVTSNTLRIMREAFAAKKNKPETAVVVLDKTGAVLAMVGGTDYRKTQFNHAVTAKRQPGSSFKPFVYLAALEAGYLPGDLVNDAPFSIGSYSPQNHDGQYHGVVPLSYALAQSLNTAAVKVGQKVGYEKVVEAAQLCGITEKMEPNPSLALGTTELTPLTMAGGYATIANFGRAVTPYVIKSIKASSGEKLYTRKAEEQPERFSETTAQNLISMMRMVVTSGTGVAANPGFPVAGKTGTSQENRDAWFIGFSSSIVTAVWVGNDNNKPMPGVYGGTVPARIFKAAITEAQGARPALALGTANPYAQSTAEIIGVDESVFANMLDGLFGEAQNQTGPAAGGLAPGVSPYAPRSNAATRVIVKPVMEGDPAYTGPVYND